MPSYEPVVTTSSICGVLHTGQPLTIEGKEKEVPVATAIFLISEVRTERVASDSVQIEITDVSNYASLEI